MESPSRGSHRRESACAARSNARAASQCELVAARRDRDRAIRDADPRVV